MMQLTRIRSVTTPALAFVTSLAGAMTAPAFAAQHSVEIAITNTGDAGLACGAAIAHWFSEDLGHAAPGETLEFRFGYDLTSGTVFRLNDVGDEMAVQRVWCGLAGNAWPTRAEIPLERRAGEAPAPVALDCAAAEGTTRCTAKAAE